MPRKKSNEISPADIIYSEGGSTAFGKLLGYGKARVGNWRLTGIPHPNWAHIIECTKGRVTREMLEAQLRYMDKRKASAA